MLDCVVSGCVAGAACAKYMLGDRVSWRTTEEVAKHTKKGDVWVVLHESWSLTTLSGEGECLVESAMCCSGPALGYSL